MMQRASGSRLANHPWLALLYLVLALSLAIRLACVTPPFEVADEAAHFLRAVQVGQGGIIATSTPNIGGDLPQSADDAHRYYDTLHFGARIVLDRSAAARAAALTWRGPVGRVTFANTAIYPPVFYLPAALAIDAGRIGAIRVIATLRIARITNAIAATLIAASAILIAESGATLLAFVLALPMTLSLFGSVSQDAMTIATAALLAAWLTRADTARAGWPGWILAGSAFGALGAARAPYTILALLPAVVAWRGEARLRGCAASAVGFALSLLWFCVGASPVMMATHAGGSVLGGAQAHALLAHPATVIHVAVATLRDDGGNVLRNMVGVLGWLDIPLPPRFYTGVAIAGVALAILSAGRSRAAFARPAVALLLVATVGAVYGALYLSWSALGATHVDGVQGRYFTPVLLFAALLLPSPKAMPRGRSHPAWRSFRNQAAGGLVLLLLIADHAVVPAAIASRYETASR